MKINYFLFLFFFCFGIALGQTKSSMTRADSLLQVISKLQSPGTSFYHSGMFPSQRGRHKRKEDDNIFFTSLISFTLENLKKDLSISNQLLSDSICNKGIRNYSYYKNQKGMHTYNFWQTNPPKFFPNSHYLSSHKYFNIPDDADCTAIIYLTDSTLKDKSIWLKDKLAHHANLTSSKIKSTYHKYSGFKAYSTWFGKNMPIEFDICVQTNILYFVYENKLKLNENDSATIAVIKSMIMSGKYLRNSNFVSPSYKKPSVVLYHLARLLGKFQIQGLEDCRAIIKFDIEKELKKKNSFMEQVILSSSMIRLGGNPKPVIYPPTIDTELQKFVFFDADLFSPYARPSFKFISQSNIFISPFHCKAYSLTLLLEYELLQKRKE